MKTELITMLNKYYEQLNETHKEINKIYKEHKKAEDRCFAIKWRSQFNMKNIKEQKLHIKRLIKLIENELIIESEE